MTGIHRGALRGVLTIAAVALGLSACGGSSSSSATSKLATETPDQVLSTAIKAATSASTVHVAGQGIGDSGSVALDLTIKNGVGATGTFAYQGTSMRLTVLNGSVYIKVTQALAAKLSASEQLGASALLGRWLKAPESGQFAVMAQFTDLSKVFGQMTSSHGKLVHAGTATVDGQHAVVIKDEKDGSLLYVAASGPAYPLRIAKGHAGQIDFTGYNQPLTLTAPANAIDLSALR